MSGESLDICIVAGARPNFMKIAPLAWVAAEKAGVDVRIVHTGQHYDKNMSDLFFEELRIPEPHANLGVGSASHARQTAEIMIRFEEYALAHRPDVVCVVGDVNSTIACALVAVKLGIPVAHVEAGLRSFDMTMPEEINRILTDRISDVLFVTEPSGVANLEREGVDPSRIHFTGNVMIDTLLRTRQLAERSSILEDLGVEGERYGVVTLHRPANVDDPRTLDRVIGALEVVAAEMPLVFPIHPRTQARLRELGKSDPRGVRLIDPVGYIDFLRLQSCAAMILTDSGGIQEEATILGVPCLTLRENTERPVTIEVGCNKLVGTDPDQIITQAMAIVRGEVPKPSIPRYWDGRAAERILAVLQSNYRGDTTCHE